MVRKFIIYILIIFLCMTFGSKKIIAEDKYSGIIRLHIIANSDLKEDQNLKLAVRDKVLISYLKDLKKLESNNSVQKYLNKELKNLERKIITLVKEKGFKYKAKVVFNESYFPTRKYGEKIYPAGKYLALKVILGKGKGSNWWCVLYPPLCWGEFANKEPVPVFAKEKKNTEKEVNNLKNFLNTYLKIIKIICSCSKSPLGDFFVIK